MLNTKGDDKTSGKQLKLIFKVAYDGLRIGIQSRFTPGVQIVFKQLGGWWHHDSKHWFFDPVKSAEPLCKELTQRLSKLESNYNVSNASKFVFYALANRKPYCFSSDLDVRLFNIRNQKTIVMVDSYDKFLVEAIQKLQGRKNEEHQVWVIPGKKPEEVASFLEVEAQIEKDEIYINENVFIKFDPSAWRDVPKPKLTVGAQTAVDPSEFYNPDEDEDLIKKKAAIELASIVSLPIERNDVDETMLSLAEKNFGLRVYQTEGVRRILSQSSTLLADDMGLGKTLQAMVAAELKRVNGVNVIICPASLLINWNNELKKFMPKTSRWIYGVNKINGEKQDISSFASGDSKPDWIVASYGRSLEILKLCEEMEWEIDTTIFDEAHYLKGLSLRTEKAFALSQNASNKILVTGTPMLNDVGELYTLLKLSGHKIGEYPRDVFKNTFGRGKANREKLGKLVEDFVLRRTKKDKLDLPPKFRYPVELVPSDRFFKEYESLENNEELLPIEKVQQAMRLLEEEKIPHVVDLCRRLGESDKAIVFTRFVDTQYEVLKALRAEGVKATGFSGKEKPEIRGERVQNFQEQKDMKVIVISMGAGSEGLNIQEANKIIVTSLPWTPSQLEQMEARAHRGGVEHPVDVVILQIAGTIDNPLWEILQYKAEQVRDVLRGAKALSPKEMEESIALSFFNEYGLGRDFSAKDRSQTPNKGQLKLTA